MSLFEYLVHFVFCQLNFIVLFPFLVKYYHILFIIIVFWFGCDRPSGLLLLLSMLTPLFLPSLSVSLCYFVLAVPMRECLGKTLVHEFPMSYSYTEWYLPFSRGEIVYRPKLCLSKSNLTN